MGSKQIFEGFTAKLFGTTEKCEPLTPIEPTLLRQTLGDFAAIAAARID